MTTGTCGDTLGAVSFWLKIVNCSGTNSGIITTLPTKGAEAGLLISCFSGNNGNELIG